MSVGMRIRCGKEAGVGDEPASIHRGVVGVDF